MSKPWMIADVLARLPPAPCDPLPAPMYFGLPSETRPRVGLAVEEMKRHTSSEGWDLFAGLEHAGYLLAGHALDCGETDVPTILDGRRPGVVVVQDEREWQGMTAGRRGPGPAAFRRTCALSARADIFTGTVLKDAQNNWQFHRRSAEGMGAHFWITYYATPIVCRLAGFVRERHVVRTYHTVDPALVPAYDARGRAGCLLSGAVSGAYPLRQRLMSGCGQIPELTVLKHPGYHRSGCQTPDYLRLLSTKKASVCTASRFGYALKKIVEAVACGCVCVTDLPADDVLPHIDAALVRVHQDAAAREVAAVVRHQLAAYNPERAAHFAELALAHYDWRVMGAKLAADIEALRRSYP